MSDDYAEFQLIGVYETHRDAEEAIRRCADCGAPIHRFSIIARTLETREDVQGFCRAPAVAAEGAMQGAWVGVILGVATAAAYWLIPTPIRIIPFCVATAGVIVASAFCGALLRAASFYFSPAHRALKYRRSIQSGGYLVLCRNVDTLRHNVAVDASEVWPPAACIPVNEPSHRG